MEINIGWHLCYDNFFIKQCIKPKILSALCRQENKGIAGFLFYFSHGHGFIMLSFLYNFYQIDFQITEISPINT